MATKQTAKRSTAKKATRKATRKATSTVKTTARKAATAARKTTRPATNAAKKRAPATRQSTGAPRRRNDGARRVDALTLLKQEHREVAELFKRFERAGNGARRKEQLRDAIVVALSQHAAIEEVVFYPAVRKRVRSAESTVLESLEEHHVVKLVLSEMEDLDARDERFTAKMTVMIENVRHHVKEEEQELFPKVRKAISRADLLDIGDALQQAKRSAPTRPHPYSPDEPPGNALVGGAVAVMDRARTTGKKAVRRVRSEINV